MISGKRNSPVKPLKCVNSIPDSWVKSLKSASAATPLDLFADFAVGCNRDATPSPLGADAASGVAPSTAVELSPADPTVASLEAPADCAALGFRVLLGASSVEEQPNQTAACNNTTQQDRMARRIGMRASR